MIYNTYGQYNVWDSGAPAVLVAIASTTDNQLDNGDTGTMSGASSYGDNSIVSYAWTQISGDTVTLSGANTDTASFTVPASTDPQQLRFRLTITDSEGNTATSTVSFYLNGFTLDTGGIIRSLTRNPVRSAIRSLIR